MGELEVLAFKLAVLTFYIGVLVYALPIPVRPLKKWAPTLIYDSLTAILLISLYKGLYAAASLVSSLAGGSWHRLQTWSEAALVNAVTLKTVSILTDYFSDRLGLIKPLASLLGGIAGDLAYAIVALIVLITVLTELVTKYSSQILVVGLVLYSIPFRIARPAGAWLISFIIIFNAGLPLMPVFLEAVGDPGELELSLDYKFLSVDLVSGSGEPVAAGQLWIYAGDEVIAVYPVIGGKAVSMPEKAPLVAVPVEGKVRLEFVHMATRFKSLEPREINLAELDFIDSVTVTVPEIIWTPHESLMFYSTVAPSEFNVEYIENYEKARAVIPLREGEFAEILWRWGCNVRVDFNVLEGDIDDATGIWKWNGHIGRYIYLEALEDSVIEVIVEYETGSCPSIESALRAGLKDYRERAAPSFIDYLTTDIIKLILIYYITMPFAYLTILFIATTSFAKLLGGGASIRLKFK